jgi:pimeloyl-ACP methyl ester carboxylesterase
MVDVVAPDGVKLKATYTSPGRPGPAVLLLHMCNSDRTAWAGLAEKLAERGIHSLALDYRGYGDSGGERGADDPQVARAIRTELWPGDFDAAFDLLRSRPGVDTERLAAGGGSCGVNNSVQLARRHPGQIKTLVLLAGTTDRPGEKYLEENPWLPILASAALDDNQAVETTRWTMNFSGHAHNVFLEYADGGHGTEIFAPHPDLETAIADWYETHLVSQPISFPTNVTVRPGSSAVVWNTVEEGGGVKGLLTRLRHGENGGEGVYLPPEAPLNLEGYRRIGVGDTAGAIEILTLNVEAYPLSANALDSLGDAYLAAGELERAAYYAKKAIEAIADDPSLSEQFAEAIRLSATGKLQP